MPVHVLWLRYVYCYTDLFYGVGCWALFVYCLGPCMPIFLGCGAFIYGVVLVTVTTITWSGACVHLNFFAKTWGFVGFELLLHLFCVSGTLFVGCYWGVT